MHISAKIRDLRIRKGYSVLRLSMMAQISQSYLYEIEKGRKVPTIDTLEKICGVFKISLADFFSDMTDVKKLPDIEEPEIFRNFYRLSPSQQKVITKLVSYMLESES